MRLGLIFRDTFIHKQNRTRQGKGRFEEFFDKRVDPNNRTYYWLAGKRMNIDHEDDVDEVVIRQNKVSITPIRYDLTDVSMLDELSRWNITL